MKKEIQKILDRNFTRGNNNKALNELFDLFNAMASVPPNLENIDYDYKKDKFIHKYNCNEYLSVELISFYNLDADKLCEIMLPHLPIKQQKV